MSTNTLEEQVPAVEEKKSGEEELWKMVANIRAEFPNGFFYFLKDGTISDGPWVLLSIEAEERAQQQDGSTDTVHYAKIRRPETGQTLRILLGELMQKPLVSIPGKH